MKSRYGHAVVVLALVGCRPEPPPIAVRPTPLRRDLELTAQQSRRLSALASAADANPRDPAARKRSGLAHLRYTLRGVLRLRDRAEQDLEAAFALTPDDRGLTRALGRFYNLRAVGGDDSKAALQVEVYRAHLQGVSVGDMSSAQFVAHSFAQLGQILSARNRGHFVEALSRIRTLEGQLAQRVRDAPGDVELAALAGNFAFFFAGNVPVGKRERVRAAVAYFASVRARWDAMRLGARNPGACPNTYENFMFELAEGYTVLERTDDARPIYQELASPSEPWTRPKEQIAYVSAERLRNLERYAGQMKLMPPWPSDEGNCVVCHAYASDVPMQSLYALEPILLEDIPHHGPHHGPEGCSAAYDDAL